MSHQTTRHGGGKPAAGWLDDRKPLLNAWRVIMRRGDGTAYRRGNVKVIRSVALELDGHHWVHVSVSLPDRIPPYALLGEVKDTFIGEDMTAIQVFPPKAKHVNIHSYCLHLWACLDAGVIPDFTQGGRSI